MPLPNLACSGSGKLDSASFSFHGRRALVTGGSRGIGAAIAKSLAAHGAHVFVNYRDDDRSAQATLHEIEAAGGSATLLKANLVHPEEIREMFQRIGESGPLGVLVHSAAMGVFKPIMELRANQWDLSFNINARALLLCAQEAAKLMQKEGGKIVSISSLGSSRYVPSYGAIGVSKAAMESLTRYLAAELAPLRINVNAVSAGLVDTPSVRRHPGYPELQARTESTAGRAGKPEDIASIVLFLCSPLSGWINGQTIVADGGMSLML
ncbi:MAG TPA: SDR family oxidoreductase [Acidobacteriota bacterium]|jgi:enoyl-[acyl-carrier protein] reductase III